MPQGILAGLFLVHGLISTANGLPAVTRGGGDLANPGWLNWWPTHMGRSWLLDAAHLSAAGYAAGGLLWLASGVAFAAAGLGLFGVPALKGVWQPLALAGGGLGVAAVVVFFHPLYALGLLINLAVLATRAGVERSPFNLAGA